MLIDRIIYEKFFDKYFYIITFLSYFFLIIIYRFLLPFGDEPDFHIRASSVVNGLQEWWTPIDFIRLSFLYDFFSRDLNYLSKCNITYDPFSIFTKINNFLCSDTLLNNISRIVLSLTHMIFFLMILFIINQIKFLKINNNGESRTLLLSILVPSIIYYFNLLSHESFFYILSFFIFIFRKNFFVLIFLLLIFFYIDFGNSIAIFIFFSLYLLFNILIKFIPFKFINIIFFFLLIISIFATELIIDLIMNYNIFLNDQIYQFIQSTIRHNFENPFRDKYPLILRPILTYMNFLFLTPGYIKILPFYLLASLFLIYIFYKTLLIIFLSEDQNVIESTKMVTISIFTILFLTLNLPALTNAKYFIFLLPFFINHIKIITNNNLKFFYYLMLSNFLVTSNLLIYRII